MIPAPFRMTAEDLEGADKKTVAALEPVLAGINDTLSDVVQILTKGITADNLADEVKTVKVVVDELATFFPFKFRTSVTQPRVVVLANVQPEDAAHSLATPFVMQGYTLTDSGLISIPAICGVLAGNSYTFTFWIR